ncbi:hypothetical protein HK096_004090 [Nowakowskiella sp. JEL0078]|nr:hypothetical protein HK096_004090 [Nowakowskiella sp. JEL0078]
MTGSLLIKGKRGPAFFAETNFWPPKFVKFILTMESGDSIAFTDPRRLSRVWLKSDPLCELPISKLGFDPLIDMPLIDVFTHQIKKRKLPIKALLLDQSFSAGIGNWLADEILFQSQIHPAQRTDDLSDENIQKLHEKMEFIVKKAVELDADSSKFPSDWIFDQRWNKGKKVVSYINEEKIEFVTVAGRTSAIVPTIQKLSKLQVRKLYLHLLLIVLHSSSERSAEKKDIREVK